MALFDASFERFDAADFDAYAPSRRSSNRYNLQRQQVRLRLTALLERVLGALPDGLELVATLDHPHFHNGRSVAAQEVAVCRTRALRDRLQAADASVDAEYPEDAHLRFGIRVDDLGVETFLDLPTAARFDREVTAGLHDAFVAFAAGVQAEAPSAEAWATGGPALRIAQRVSRTDALALETAAIDAAIAAAWALAEPILAAVARAELPTVAEGASASQDDDTDRVAVRADAPAPVGVASEPGDRAKELRPLPPRLQRPRPEPLPPRPVGEPAPAPRYRRNEAVARPTIAAPGSASPDPIDVAREQALQILRESGRPAAPEPRRDARGPRSDARPGPNRRDGGARGGGFRHDAGREAPGPRTGGARRPFEVGPDAPAKRPEGVSVGATVVIRSGLLAGREAEVLAVKGKEARVSAGGLELTMPLSELSAT